MDADTQEKQVFLIPATNMPRLKDEIERLNKRAKKLNCQPLVLNVLETVEIKKKDPVLKVEYTSISYNCSITGESPKLNGWTLVAAIEPLTNKETKVTENIVREVPGVHCPVQYRTTNMECQHCHTIRRRSAIFVLRNENGDYKQVGRNCIADFLGNVSPDQLLSKAEYLWGAISLMGEASDEEWGCSGGRGERVVGILHFVTIVSVVCRRLGWVPRSKADENNEPTASIAWTICTSRPSKELDEYIKRKNLIAEERDSTLAEEAVKWGAAIDPATAQSTYLYDLGVCCRQDVVRGRTSGYVASVVSAYKRHLAEEYAKTAPVAKDRPVKQHVGALKQRLVLTELTVTHATSYSTDYGAKTFIRMTDPNQNVLVWRATGSPEWAKIGHKVDVKATIKSHEIFNGQPNTILNRVDLVKEHTKPVESNEQVAEATATV